MDYESLPHFCRREGSGSSRHSRNGMVSDCFSLDYPFHQQLYNYVKEQAALKAPVRHGSMHVDYPEPDPEDVKIVQSIECEFQRIGNQNGHSQSLQELKISGDWSRVAYCWTSTELPSPEVYRTCRRQHDAAFPLITSQYLYNLIVSRNCNNFYKIWKYLTK